MSFSIHKNNEILVIGIGACTSIGINAPMSAASVNAGVNRFNEHPYMLDKSGEPMVVAMASYLPEDINGIDRFMELLIPAVKESLSPLKQSGIRNTKIPLILGLPEKRPGLLPYLEQDVVRQLNEIMDDSLEFSDIITLQQGHSAGLLAIEKAVNLINSGKYEFCLAGGLDSYMTSETLEWLDYQEQLLSDENKWGFIPGEASGLCLIGSQRAVKNYQLKSLCTILSAATETEKNRIKTDTVCIGEGLTKAMRKSLSVINYPDLKIDNILCDFNGERYRADEFGFTLARLSDYFDGPTDFMAPADCWGDIGAASGPNFINLAAVLKLNGYTMAWTSSEGGERSALIFHV